MTCSVQGIERGLFGSSSIGSIKDRDLQCYDPGSVMRRLTRAAKGRSMILLVALLSFAMCVGGLGATPLHGTWEWALAFGFPFAVQTDSDTYSKLKLAYTASDWTFDSLSTFGVSGLLSQQFDASGSLGLIVLNSQLLFSPILGSPPATFTDSKTVSEPQHQYDLGVPYFIGSVTITSLTITPAGSHWKIVASLDGTTPIWESQDFAGDAPPAVGPIPVGVVARYITIVTIVAGGASLTQSAVTISVSSESWITTARTVSGGVTVFGTFTLATGYSSLALGVTGAQGDNLPVSGIVYFDLETPGCSFCFDRFEGSFGLSFGCIGRATATLRINSAGFDQLTFACTGLEFGLPDITFDITVGFSLTTKTITLSPLLNLSSNTCLTVYASLVPGPDGAWEISGLSIYGLRFSYSWDGVVLESLSYLDDLHHVKDTYWERFTIKSVGDTCCGGRFEFSVSTYFDKTSVSLFDWAETETSLSFGVTAALTARVRLVIQPGGPEELVLGGVFNW